MNKNTLVKFLFNMTLIIILAACGTSGGNSSSPASGKDVEEIQPYDSYSLVITGDGVEKETAFTLEELKGLPDALFEGEFFALNNYGTKTYFEFEGARLAVLLKVAGLLDTAESVTFIAEDGYEKSITIEEALREDYIDEQNPDASYPVLIAWKENGEDYDSEDGAPFRLVLGQKEPGDINKPGWVMNIVEISVN